MDRITKSLNYYRKLPYTFITSLARDDHGNPFWEAEIKEFDLCIGIGKTEAAAVNNAYELFDDHVTTILEWGDKVPIPTGCQGEPSYTQKESSASFDTTTTLKETMETADKKNQPFPTEKTRVPPKESLELHHENISRHLITA